LSVCSALHALEDRAAETDWVLVHDAARPCLRQEDLERLFVELGDRCRWRIARRAAQRHAEARANRAARQRNRVRATDCGARLTPQMFRFGLLHRALCLCVERQRAVTDEASAIEMLGLEPRVVRGHADKIKVTNAEDAALAAAILASRNADTRGVVAMRVGSGFDVHAFGPGDHVTIGGVHIPYERGVVAHSDGDVRCTRCAMQSLARWVWVTSGSISPTRIGAGKAPTAVNSCVTAPYCCDNMAGAS
jgi:hypothetical protein